MSSFDKIDLSDYEVQWPYQEEKKIWDKFGFIPELIELYRLMPDVWIRRFLEVSLWLKQIEICRAIAKYPAVTVRSCHDSGKSFIAGCLVVWFFIMFKDSKIITTAPTGRQVKKVLWSEIGRQHRILAQKVANAGELFQTELRDGPTHYALGFSTDEGNAFQGFHELNLLAIFDEACGIPREIFKAAEGVLTTEGNKQLLIGNPTHPNTYFHQTHTGEIPGYYRIRISAYDTPNIAVNEKGEYYEVKPKPFPKLTPLSWINKMITTYGPRDPDVIARVFGEFPSAAPNQLIDDEAITLAATKGSIIRKLVSGLGSGRDVIPPEQIKALNERMDYSNDV
jgi:hypothetical protein